MIVTYYNERELESYRKVNDEELNELFQEVREKFSNHFLMERVFEYKKNLFSKKENKTLYSLLISNNSECQVFNFAPDGGQSSINTYVSKGTIMNYFFGLLNGLKWKQRQEQE